MHLAKQDKMHYSSQVISQGNTSIKTERVLHNSTICLQNVQEECPLLVTNHRTLQLEAITLYRRLPKRSVSIVVPLLRLWDKREGQLIMFNPIWGWQMLSHRSAVL